jgi:hypothetical protein
MSNVFDKFTTALLRVGQAQKVLWTSGSVVLSPDKQNELFNSNVYPLIKTNTESLAISQMNKLRSSPEFKQSIYNDIDNKLNNDLSIFIANSGEVQDLKSQLHDIRTKYAQSQESLANLTNIISEINSRPAPEPQQAQFDHSTIENIVRRQVQSILSNMEVMNPTIKDEFDFDFGIAKPTKQESKLSLVAVGETFTVETFERSNPAVAKCDTSFILQKLIHSGKIKALAKTNTFQVINQN